MGENGQKLMGDERRGRTNRLYLLIK